MLVQLDPTKTASAVYRGLSVRASGLRGTVDVSAGPAIGARTFTPQSRLEPYFAEAGLTTSHTAVIDAQYALPAPAPRGSKRGPRPKAAPSPTTLAIEVEPPPPDTGQVLLEQDTVTGVLRWIVPDRPTSPASAKRGAKAGPPPHTAQPRRYSLHIDAPPAPDARPGTPAARGLIGFVVKKVVKVLTYALSGPIGSAANAFARAWESKNRPYGLYWLDADSIMSGARHVVSGPDWAQVGSDPALLLIHGTFSTCAGGFGGLDVDTVGQLRQRYGNRVLEFDHFTVSDTPIDNVNWLLDQIPDGTNPTFDVITHSRGGLVGRVIAEGNAGVNLGNPRRATVRRLAMVASPNEGTVLTATGHISDFIDLYTNLALLPDNPVGTIVGGVIELVKDVAAQAVNALAGLECMDPGGPFLAGMNQAMGAATYYGIASNYEPTSASPIQLSVDFLADQLFEQDNDLVVPTLGGTEATGPGQFSLPDERKLKLAPDQGVSHSAYFGHPDVRRQLLTWLQP